jgi:broad specificity phosphatase PhoE
MSRSTGKRHSTFWWRERPADVAFEDGESLRDVAARWKRFRAILQIGKPTLLVTHDAIVIVRVALLDIAQRSLTDFWSMRVENAAYAVVDVDGARWSLAEESVNGHLAERRAATESQAL